MKRKGSFEEIKEHADEERDDSEVFVRKIMMTQNENEKEENDNILNHQRHEETTYSFIRKGNMFSNQGRMFDNNSQNSDVSISEYRPVEEEEK